MKEWMKEWAFADKIMFPLALFTGLSLLVLKLLVFFNCAFINIVQAEKSIDFISSYLIAMMIYCAMRLSAIEERKQRREYEASIETLLKRIAAHPKATGRRSSRRT